MTLREFLKDKALPIRITKTGWDIDYCTVISIDHDAPWKKTYVFGEWGSGRALINIDDASDWKVYIEDNDG